MKRQVVLIAHNLRSCHNVGSLFRTAEGLGVIRLYLTGYTPYPKIPHDTRLPHIATKLHNQIHKTALGTEISLDWAHNPNIFAVIEQLKDNNFCIVALEQTPHSVSLPLWSAPDKLALILGRETEGVEQEVLNMCDIALEIPMAAKKESFNVVQAAAMALYHCRFGA